MKIAWLLVIVAIAPLISYSDSYPHPQFLEIGFSQVGEKTVYTMGKAELEEGVLRTTLKSIRKLSPKKMPIVQIDIGSKSKKISAEQLLSLINILHSEGYKNISFIKPHRVGMYLKRQPIMIREGRENEKNK